MPGRDRPFTKKVTLVMDQWVFALLDPLLPSPRKRSWVIELLVRDYIRAHQPPADGGGLFQAAQDPPDLVHTPVPEGGPTDMDEAMREEIQRRAQEILAQRLAAETGTGACARRE